MVKLKIQGYNNNLHLGFEPYKNKVRIVLLDDNGELAQIIKSLKRLEVFIEKEDKILFSVGILKLSITKSEIHVFYRKAKVGSVGKEEFIMAAEMS